MSNIKANYTNFKDFVLKIITFIIYLYVIGNHKTSVWIVILFGAYFISIFIEYYHYRLYDFTKRMAEYLLLYNSIYIILVNILHKRFIDSIFLTASIYLLFITTT